MKKHVIYSFILSAAFTFSSCSDLLDIQPRQSLDVDVALNTREKIQSAVTNTYTYLKAQALYGRDLLAIADALADDSRIINRAGGRFVNEGQNVPNNHLTGWATYYNAINDINLILKALPDSPFSPEEQKSYEGELKFLRALYYFNLARIYAFDPKVAIPAANKGGVPLMLEGVNSPDQVQYPTRASVADVYKQLYDDLTTAVAQAPTSGGPNKATRAAAQALFARVALYNEDWDNAIKYATEALAGNTGRFLATGEYIAGWRSNRNPEAIFEVLFQTRQESLGVNNSLQSAYSSIESVEQANNLAIIRPNPLPPATGWGSVVPTAAFLNLFQADDIRRQLYQEGLNRANTVVIETTKFLGKTGTLYMDNVPVIRFSELYLIRAEANARKAGGDLAAALADVNRIRTRAGLGAVTGLTQPALVNEIMLQRRLEFAFEGHRWFDLKRLGQDVVKTTGNVPYGDYRILAPIPTSEILANKNLVQNANY